MIREASVTSFSMSLTEKISTATNNLNSDGSNQSTIQNIFDTTSCYDLMQTSSKAVVFEVTIPFQLAFYAMIENDTEVAPLWDPESRSFIGLLTTYDYINALRICLSQRYPSIAELESKSIAEVLAWPVLTFNHPYFDPLEPDESIYQLCRVLYNSKSDFIPIVDPETGNLVTILGYMDIIHLVDCAAKQYPSLFSDTLDQLGILGRALHPVITINRSQTLNEVLSVLDSHHINGAPVVDEAGKVINFYHKSDVTFIIKAPEPDAILTNLRGLTIGEILALREQLIASGEAIGTTQGLVTCSVTDQVHAVLNAMMLYRVTKVVVVDQLFSCIGVVSIKDILAYYLANGTLP